MSTIGSGIAASAAQAMVQTNQSAKAADAARNRDEALAKKMRELLEQHTHEVENSTKADGQKSRIHDEQRDQSGRRRRRAQDHYEQSLESARSDSDESDADASQSDQRPAPHPSPAEPIHRLDITA